MSMSQGNQDAIFTTILILEPVDSEVVYFFPLFLCQINSNFQYWVHFLVIFKDIKVPLRMNCNLDLFFLILNRLESILLVFPFSFRH